MKIKSLFLSFLLLSQSLLGVPLMAGEESNNPKGAVHITLGSENIIKNGVDTGAKLEIITMPLQNELEDARAAQMVASEFKSAPQSHKTIVQLSEDGVKGLSDQKAQDDFTKSILQKTGEGPASQVEVIKAPVPLSIRQKMEARLQGSKELFYKHERISLSLLRASVNGTIVSLGLILNTGLPAVTALPIGMLTGSFSGLMQYFNPQVQRFLEGNAEKNKELMSTGRFGTVRVKTVQLTKWFMMEAGLYTIIDAFSFAIGAPMEGINKEAIKVIKSSLMATASQGVWDATIATETRQDLSAAGNDEALKRRIQFRSNVITFGVSMASVFGGILSLMGSPLGTWALGALGVGGAIYTAKNWFRNRGLNNGVLAGQSATVSRLRLTADCRAIFMP